MAVQITCCSTIADQTQSTSNQPIDTNEEGPSKLEDLIKKGDEKGICAELDRHGGDKEYLDKLAAYRIPASEHDSDITLMHLAAYYRLPSTVMKKLFDKCPSLVEVKRSKIHHEQTVLHILVATKDTTSVKNLLKSKRVTEAVGLGEKLLNTSMDTRENLVSSQTELLGGLPLSIAALTFDEDMVKILLENGAHLYSQNHQKETVFHSLVRFSYHHPDTDKKENALKMMKFLNGRLLSDKHDPRTVWLLKNEDSLTALQLAAQLTQPALFDYIIRLAEVYRRRENSDGVFDFLRYDITEIDPAAMKKVNDKKINDRKNKEKQAKMKESETNESTTQREGKFRAPIHGISVLEIINNTARDFDATVEILNNHIVNNVVEARWKMWKCFFWIWAVLHLVVIIWYSAYTAFKARKFIGRDLGGTDRNFVLGSAGIFAFVSGILMVYGLVIFIYKLVDTISRKDGQLHERLFQFFRSFSWWGLLNWVWFFLLFLDSVLFLSCWHENEVCNPETTTPVTTVTLIAGWSICPLFLRPVKMFSFFTIMLREVFVGDMLRFLTIFIPALASFSLAMHIIFLPSSPDDLPSCDGTLVVNCTSEDFKTYPRTLLTMFKLMLGLTEIERLLDAPENLRLLAVILYIVFVLLTYALMLNALIALMSNTCSGVSKNRDNQWKKERLAVMMFLQKCFPHLCWARHCVGDEESVKRKDYQNHGKERTRYTMKIPTKRMEDLEVTSSDKSRNKGKSKTVTSLQKERIILELLKTKSLTMKDFVKNIKQLGKTTDEQPSSSEGKDGTGDSTSGTMDGVKPQVHEISETKPTDELTVKSAAETTTQPTAQSTTQSTTQPTAQSTTQSTTQPTAQSTTQSTVSQLPGTPDAPAVDDTNDNQESSVQYSHAHK